jgi:hypothetical protein
VGKRCTIWQLLLLHDGIRGQILTLAPGLRANLIPFVGGPIALDDGGVDYLAHAEAEMKKTPTKTPATRGNDDAVDVDVRDS